MICHSTILYKSLSNVQLVVQKAYHSMVSPFPEFILVLGFKNCTTVSPSSLILPIPQQCFHLLCVPLGQHHLPLSPLTHASLPSSSQMALVLTSPILLISIPSAQI